MAPTRTRNNATTLPLSRKAISTRQNSQNIIENIAPDSSQPANRGKRKAEASPIKNGRNKRFALGNLTNNVVSSNLDEEQSLKKASSANKTGMITKSNVLKSRNENSLSLTNQQVVKQASLNLQLRNKIVTRSSTSNKVSSNIKGENACIPLSEIQNQLFVSAQAASKTNQNKLPVAVQKKKSNVLQNQKQIQKNEDVAKDNINVDSLDKAGKPTTRRISNEFDKIEESLYMSALEYVPSSQESIRFSGNFDLGKRKSISSVESETISENLGKSGKDELNRIASPTNEIFNHLPPPSNVTDFDKENWNDPFQVSHYAFDIFNYLKHRESEFLIDDYIHRQNSLTKWMRSLLIDWMVEVQETFELNHETLYLAVKLVDMYLSKVIVQKDKLQLLGAGALFIACKYDERTPPLVEDFLYICDGAYHNKELIKMEKSILKVVDFDLGMPLSYRFLRRYARCAKILMPTLTLARYILENSLMDYDTISLSDSKLASAALYIALKMVSKDSEISQWDSTLEYYTGYKLEEFAFIIVVLNAGLHRKAKDSIKTIRQKYSHKLFFEVANTPLLTTEKLFENTGLIEDVNITNEKNFISL